MNIVKTTEKFRFLYFYKVTLLVIPVLEYDGAVENSKALHYTKWLRHLEGAATLTIAMAHELAVGASTSMRVESITRPRIAASS